MGKYTFISREATGLISSVLGDVVYCGSAVICGFRTSQELLILIRVCSWQVFTSRVCCELCPSWSPRGDGAEWGSVAAALWGDVFYVVLGSCRGHFGGDRWGLLFPVSPGALGAAVIKSNTTLGECSWLQPRGRWMCPAPSEGGQLQFKLGAWSSPGCRRVW